MPLIAKTFFYNFLISKAIPKADSTKTILVIRISVQHEFAICVRLWWLNARQMSPKINSKRYFNDTYMYTMLNALRQFHVSNRNSLTARHLSNIILPHRTETAS